MNFSELKSFLDEKVELYNNPNFIESDPIQIPYLFSTKEDIEIAMTKAVNYPKGLLHWADEIGITECVNKMDELYHQPKHVKYILKKMRTCDNESLP